MRAIAAFAAASLLALSACSTSRVALPHGFQGQRYAVDGFQNPFSKSFTFGPWAATDVHGRWISSREAEVSGDDWELSSVAAHTPDFGLTLRGTGTTWTVSCRIETETSGLSVDALDALKGELDLSTRLTDLNHCDLTSDQGRRLSFDMAHPEDAPPVGVIREGDRTWTATATRDREGRWDSAETAGWIVREQDRVLLVVDSLNAGAINLERTGDADALAATGAALLLWNRQHNALHDVVEDARDAEEQQDEQQEEREERLSSRDHDVSRR